MRKPDDNRSTTSTVVDDRHVRGQSIACPHEHMDDDGGPVRVEPEQTSTEWAGF